MSNVSGCEMRKCEFHKYSEKFGKKICTDPCSLYDKICRYNDYWQTEEGKAEADAYFANLEAKNNGETPNAESGDTVRGVADILTDLRDYDMSDGQQALCDELEKAINRIRNARDKHLLCIDAHKEEIAKLKMCLKDACIRLCHGCKANVVDVGKNECDGSTGGCGVRVWRIAAGMEDGETKDVNTEESPYKAQLRDACHMLCFRCGQNDSAQGENAAFKCKLPNGECNVHAWRKSVGMDGEGAAK